MHRRLENLQHWKGVIKKEIQSSLIYSFIITLLSIASLYFIDGQKLSHLNVIRSIISGGFVGFSLPVFYFLTRLAKRRVFQFFWFPVIGALIGFQIILKLPISSFLQGVISALLVIIFSLIGLLYFVSDENFTSEEPKVEHLPSNL